MDQVGAGDRPYLILSRTRIRRSMTSERVSHKRSLELGVRQLRMHASCHCRAGIS